MEYFSYAQLLFAIIAILGMLYIEIVNDRDRRSDNNYHNFKYNLLNIAKDIKDNVVESMILECATFEDLEKIYDGFKVLANDHNKVACENEIKTKINLSEDVNVQSRLLIFPLIIIGFISVGILWMPIVKRMHAISSLYWLTPAIISIVIIYAVICACCIAKYPYVGKGRSALKKFVLIWE